MGRVEDCRRFLLYASLPVEDVVEHVLGGVNGSG